jgi:cytochrome c peroxidase
MRFQIIASTLAVGTVIAGCSMTDEFTDNEWQSIRAMEPLKGDPPRNPFNMRDQDQDLAKLGQMMFFDKDVGEAIKVQGPSGNVGDLRKVACANCHDTEYGVDSHMEAVGGTGTNGEIPGLSHGLNYLATNTGQMANLWWTQWTLWAGRFDGLVEHGTTVWGTSATPLAQAHFVYTKYKDEYNAVFPDTPLDDRLGLPATDPNAVYPSTGGPKASPTAADGPFEKMPIDAQNFMNQFRANIGRVWDTYPRMWKTPNSPFQRYVRDGDTSALSPQAKRGLRLFIGKAACNDCHNGPTLSDQKFHNVGAPNVTLLPYATTAQALNRGRAASMSAIMANLALLDADPNAVVFNGAGKYSDDQQAGADHLQQIRDLDHDHCICRKTDTVATIDACTDAVVASADQTAIRSDQTKSCLKYDDTLEGVFRTPSLLNVAKTAPYFHSGLVYSLEDVIWQYNQGGGPVGTFVGTKAPQIRPLMLTDDEVSDLAEFLRSLTGMSPRQQAAADDTGMTWDWSKNTAKPALMGTGGTMGTGTGGMGGSVGGGRGGSGGGMAGSSGTAGMAGSGAGGSTGAGGTGGTTGAGGTG